MFLAMASSAQGLAVNYPNRTLEECHGARNKPTCIAEAITDTKQHTGFAGEAGWMISIARSQVKSENKLRRLRAW